MSTLLSGIDLGSSAIRVVVAEVSDDGTITVTGRGEVPTPPSAAYMGTISNQETFSSTLRKVIEEVEVMAGFEIDRAFVGVSSPQFEGLRAMGKTHVQGRHRRVTEEDKNRVLDHCTSVKLPETYEVFAVMPMEFQVDGQQGILEPVNMVGHDLSVLAHIITCPKGLPSNVAAICNGIGIQVMALIYEPIAAVEAVVTQDEQDMGFLLLDIGYDTTHVLVMRRQAVLASKVYRVGGRHFTTDLAQVLGISQKEAETIKTARASLIKDSIGEDEAMELTTVGQGRTKVVTLANISEILYDRAEELLTMIHKDLARQSLDQEIKGGCILVGGGSKLDGIAELVERTMGTSARVGTPQDLLGLTELINKPEWATVVGVMRYGYKHQSTLWKKEEGLFKRITAKIFKGGKR